MKTSKETLAAKAIHMTYGFPGFVKKGWEAERLDDRNFRIHRENGTTRDIALMKEMRTVNGDVRPDVHESGVLTIGDYSVIIGRGINHDMHARKLSAPNTYLLFDKSMRQLGRVKIGNQIDGQPVSLVDSHLLKVGDNVIPIQPKKFEVTVLVLDSDVDGGKLCYINMIEKGNKLNRKDGAKGVFYPPRKEGELGRFIEKVDEHNLLTATFQLDPRGKKLTFRHRTVNAALSEIVAKSSLMKAKEEAMMAGIDPDEYSEYVDALKSFEEAGKAWRTDGMAVHDGHEIFAGPKNQNEYSPG